MLALVGLLLQVAVLALHLLVRFQSVAAYNFYQIISDSKIFILFASHEELVFEHVHPFLRAESLKSVKVELPS